MLTRKNCNFHSVLLTMTWCFPKSKYFTLRVAPLLESPAAQANRILNMLMTRSDLRQIAVTGGTSLSSSFINCPVEKTRLDTSWDLYMCFAELSENKLHRSIRAMQGWVQSSKDSHKRNEKKRTEFVHNYTLGRLSYTKDEILLAKSS